MPARCMGCILVSVLLAALYVPRLTVCRALHHIRSARLGLSLRILTGSSKPGASCHILCDMQMSGGSLVGGVELLPLATVIITLRLRVYLSADSELDP